MATCRGEGGIEKMKIETELIDTLQVWKYKQNKLLKKCPIDKVGYEKGYKQALIDCALDIELILDQKEKEY